MNKTIQRILIALLLFFAVSYSGYTIYRYFYSPYKTEAVFSYTVEDTFRSKAIVLRDETVIDSDVSGVLRYVVSDGTVVIPGSVVAQAYPSEADVANQALADSYNREIDGLKEAQGTTGQYIGADMLGKQINQAMGEITDAVARGNVGDLDGDRDTLQILLNKRQVSIGRERDFSERIAYLEAEKSYAASQVSPDHGVVKAPSGGYFCSNVDGYESVLSAKNLEDIPIENYLRAIEGMTQPVEIHGVGKIMSGHNWYLALPASAQDSEQFVKGANVTVDFGIAGHENIPAVVYEILTPDEPEGQRIVLLRCNYITSELMNLRSLTVSVQFRAFTGLKVNSKAVRYQGQTPGVYVMEGKRIVFKQINVLYEDPAFVLCSENFECDRPLKLFDDVIVEGTNLEDGKIVNIK